MAVNKDKDREILEMAEKFQKLLARQQKQAINCKNCGACRHHDRCHCCGCCRTCGQPIGVPVFPNYPYYPPYISWTYTSPGLVYTDYGNVTSGSVPFVSNAVTYKQDYGPQPVCEHPTFASDKGE